MFSTITPALQLCLSRPDIHAGQDESRDLAGECLERMEAADIGWKIYLDKESITAPGASLFDKDFVEAICQMAPPEKVVEYREKREKHNKPPDSGAVALDPEGDPVPQLVTDSPPHNEHHLNANVEVVDHADTTDTSSICLMPSPTLAVPFPIPDTVYATTVAGAAAAHST